VAPTVALTLDGRRVLARTGQTLLEACRAAGIALPTLCHAEGLSAPALCRLCLVELEGAPRPVPACATPAVDGMVVQTSTPALAAARRASIELLLANGHHVCAFCPSNGRCELQELARALGVDRVHRGPLRPRPAVDASRPGFLLDTGRCVLCTRCVRACAELERAGTLAVVGRGAATRVAVDGGIPWGSSRTCTDCGRCADRCPTGALAPRDLAAQGLRPIQPLPPVPPPGPLPASGPRARLATIWLGGCAGCHMSLLDLDERLLELAPRIELAYSPLADTKEFPPDVDLCLVEGAVTTDEQEAQLRVARARSRLLVALGDCAVVGNVPAMRDHGPGLAPLLARWAGPGRGPRDHDPSLPTLLEPVRAVGEVVPVDLVLPGCPPPAGAIHRVLVDAVAGRPTALAGHLRFG
jgi:bidirectional [NiFe] hydrogenase diaphorase subunit